MIKQFVLLIILSVIAVFFLREIHQVLNLLVIAYRTIANELAFIFAGDMTGRIVREVIALIVIPLIIGLIVNLIYWLIKKQSTPIFMAVIWAVWLLLVALLG